MTNEKHDFYAIQDQVREFLTILRTTTNKPELSDFEDLQKFQEANLSYDDWGYPVLDLVFLLASDRLYYNYITSFVKDELQSPKNDPCNSWAYWEINTTGLIEKPFVIKVPGRIGMHLLERDGFIKKTCVIYNRNKCIMNCLSEHIYETNIIIHIIIPYTTIRIYCA